IFSYDNNEFDPVDLEGYVYSDAVPEQPDDELGKLIKKSSDGSGEYALFRNEQEVMNIDIDNYANGYAFEIDTAEAGNQWGFVEDEVYQINTTQQTLTKVTEGENYAEVKTELPLSEYQALYDFLLSIVPETYIRRIIDLDKAEETKENAGLITNYVMKDDSGNVTAELKVAFGVIGEVIHHTGENEYVMLELAY
ncbi:MAG: hypothetical protein J6Q54_02940, partial [Oscillospiraceae bacterium]|nr:hypothetical protein [Oscillospiraceae bacterium]